MREIIFKAKRIDNGEWAEGYLLRDDCTGQYFIHASGNSVNESDKVNEEGCLRFVAFEVDESTICQYIGLCDKNGRNIWENDIVRTQEYSDKPYAKNRKTKRHIGVVEYDIGKGSGFYNEETETHDKYREYSAEWSVNVKDYGIYRCGNWGDFFDCEVIGNTFDNPELLEKAR